jgi:hypothetical protein
MRKWRAPHRRRWRPHRLRRAWDEDPRLGHGRDRPVGGKLHRESAERERGHQEFLRRVEACRRTVQELRIGTHAETVRYLLEPDCKPTDVNTTITGSHRHEQWVYRDWYHWNLYFDDGRLVAIQL